MSLWLPPCAESGSTANSSQASLVIKLKGRNCICWKVSKPDRRSPTWSRCDRRSTPSQWFLAGWLIFRQWVEGLEGSATTCSIDIVHPCNIYIQFPALANLALTMSDGGNSGMVLTKVVSRTTFDQFVRPCHGCGNAFSNLGFACRILRNVILSVACLTPYFAREKERERKKKKQEREKDRKTETIFFAKVSQQ